MAKTPEAVRGLLERVWTPARARALADRDALQALVRTRAAISRLPPWDWRYYAEKLRQRRANFDDAAIKPYLALDHMIEAAFDSPTGCSAFPSPSARTSRSGTRMSGSGRSGMPPAPTRRCSIGDYFARASKRSGAWMTSLRDQQKLDGDVTPLIINV